MLTIYAQLLIPDQYSLSRTIIATRDFAESVFMRVFEKAESSGAKHALVFVVDRITDIGVLIF